MEQDQNKLKHLDVSSGWDGKRKINGTAKARRPDQKGDPAQAAGKRPGGIHTIKFGGVKGRGK
jgi:hypothetical protein